MTHTSTEQPEALRLADWCDHEYDRFGRMSACAAELRRLHARVQELEAQTAHMADLVELADYATKKLEASQAQRVPLSNEYIRDIYAEESHWDIVAPYVIEFARSIERAHGITQEKQG